MDKRAIVETWFNRMWVEEDLTAVDDFLAVDVQAHGLGVHPQLSAEAFRSFGKAFMAIVRTESMTIEKTLEDGDWIHSLITVRGKSRATGAPLSFGGQVMIRIVDGKIVEGYNSIDFLQMFVQMGLLPPDAVEKGFAGERMV